MEKSKRPVIDSDASPKGGKKREGGVCRGKGVGEAGEGRRSRHLHRVSLDLCNADGETSIPTSSDHKSCSYSFEPLQFEELFLQH